MYVKNYVIIGCLLIGFPCAVFASSVVINEVMFNPTGDDTGQEWIELYNAGNEQADISGWEIYPDGTGYITMPHGMTIGAKKMVLVHLRLAGNNSATDIYQPTASSNMSNTSGSVVLFSGEPKGKDTIKSFVQWGRSGETWESTASTSELWEKNTFIDLNSFGEGNSIALNQDGVVAGGVNAWNISKTPTPGAYNAQGSLFASDSSLPSASPSDNLSAPTQSPSFASPSPSASSRTAPIKTIKAYAGEDMVSMVGAMIDFLGRAKGINDESLDASARFFWSFGDGETQEGRSVAHTYRIPGIYLAGLYVSSGEYAASDYARIQISPNLVNISSVVQGADGYIRLSNASDIEADISSWSIRDSQGHAFIVPPHTKMARHGDIAMINSVTGLLNNSGSLPLNIFYPNGMLAFTFSSSTTTNISIAQKIKEDTPILRLPNIHIAEEKKPLPPAVVERSVIPSPTPRKEDTNKYAASSHVPFVSLPFGIALGVSVLGAAVFLIAKQFSR